MMKKALPFKPLTTAILVASLFPLAHAADSYGVHAKTEDLLITEQSVFENVDYGVSAENEHSATINSDADITLSVKKAGVYVNSKKTGSVFLNAANTIAVQGKGSGAVDGFRVDSSSNSNVKADNVLEANAKNISLNSESSFTARGIYVESNTSNSGKFDAKMLVKADEALTISTTGDAYSYGIAAKGLHSFAELSAKEVEISAKRSEGTKEKTAKAFGVYATNNGTLDIASGRVVINVENHRDVEKAETFALFVEAGPGGYHHNSSITVHDADSVGLNAVAYGESATETAAIRATGAKHNRGAKVDVSAREIYLTASGNIASGVDSFYGADVTLGDASTEVIAIGNSTLKNASATNAFTGLRAYAQDQDEAAKINLQGKKIVVDAKSKTDSVGIFGASNSLINVGDADSDISISAVTDDASSEKAYGVWVFSNTFRNS